MNPGIVLISLTTTSPSSRTKKSTRAIPSHSVAMNESTASAWTRAAVSSGIRAGTMMSEPPASYFAA